MTTKSGSHLGPKQVARAFHAVRFAGEAGRSLNTLVTIDITSLGIAPEKAGAFFRDIWGRLTRWWAYQRKKGRPFGPFDAYAVHEHPEGGPRHVHWFMRVPDDAREEVEHTIRQRLEKVTKLACLGRALHFLSVDRPGGVAKYTLKGVDPLYAAHFHMEAHDQGEVIGRRITISRSIGFAARQRAGWSRKRRPRS